MVNKQSNVRLLIKQKFLFVFLIFTMALAVTAQDKPNVIFILADDLGWGDLSCYGHPYSKTPALDKLASEGIQFKRFYVTGTTCCPSRTGFMTSLHPASFPNYMAEYGFGGKTTVTELFRQNGYTTGHFGKWHIGPNSNANPVFDGIYDIDNLNVIGTNKSSDGGRDVDLFEEATRFIEENKDRPFYVNIWGHITHYPVDPVNSLVDNFNEVEVKRSDFGSYMQTQFDDCEALGGDTLGGNIEKSMRNYLADVWKRNPKQRETPLFWRPSSTSGDASMIDGNWKLSQKENTYVLYDLSTDEEELVDVANLYPEKVNELKSKMLDWISSLPNAYQKAPTTEKVYEIYEPIEDTSFNANILQHLDASIDSLVVTDAGKIVTSWKDKSGNGFDAKPGVGNAIYPSSKTFPNGLNGIDFRDASITLELLSTEASDTILNQEANPTGFSIITAVYIDENIGTWNDLIGNNTSISSGFFIRYSDSGKLQGNLGGAKSNGSEYINPGQTVIFSFNYDAENEVYQYWCSATDEELVIQLTRADFSNDSPLTIGATNGTDRHFDGMVGEVQVYSGNIPKTKRKEIIYEMGQKWGVDLPRVPQKPKARIVPTKYSDSDVAIISFNAAEAPYNADRTGTVDATKAIQSALDDAGNAPGAVVYLPEGIYRIDGNLTMKDGVTLRGDWKEPTETNKLVAGTILNIYTSKGEDSDDVNIKSPILVGASGGIRDLSIVYPEQNISNPIPYPYTIRCMSKMQTVMNVTLVNSYKGIRYETSGGSAVGHPNVYNVFGSPIKKGIRLNKAAAVPRIIGVDFDPVYWAESGLPGAPSETEILTASRSLNSVALELEQSDNGIIGDVHVRGYDLALGIGLGGQSSNMKVYDFEFDKCRIGVQAVNYKSQGWTFTKGSIRVDGEGAMAVYQIGEGIITFNDITFNSSGKLIVSTTGNLSFTNCHFQDWQDNYGIYLTNGSLVSFGNIFSKTLETGQSNIYLGAGADAAAISGNTFENSAAKIISMNADTNRIVIDTIGEYEVYRHDYPSHDIAEYFMPEKIDTSSLFNVLDYGAVGDMETENTNAFKLAIKAAAEYGGGTVYVPGGAYRINERLVIPTGVELRGVHDVPVYTGHGRSILLSYIDKTNPGDSAFVTMQEGSGIRGLVVIRPEQVYNEADNNVGTTIFDWPFAIRATGDNCSIVNTVVANADKGIDLASPGAGHHINWYLTAPIRMCLNVQTGTNPVVVDNMQTNPGLFRDIKSTLNWNLFSENTSLTGHFTNNIAPLASESQDLYPSGTAVNIKGDGSLTFYSNFYNNPFNGFIINGSPTMKSYLSGGEGEIFYTVESEGNSPIDLEIIANTYHPIKTDPSITGFGSYQLNPNSSGIIKILNTTSFGAPNVGYRINNGNLIIQSAFQTVPMQSFVEARGTASATIQGSYLRNGMSHFHGIGLNDSINFSIMGTFSENNYRVSSSVDVFGSTPRTVNKIDIETPTKPLNLEATPISSSQIELSWEQSTDNTNVAGYFVFRDGIKIATVSTTNFNDQGLNAETSYEYFITAFDDASNESNPSETVTVSTLSTGIEQLDNKSGNILVYPNPARDQVFLFMPKTNDSEITFNMYSATGILIMSKQLKVPVTKAEIQFDVSTLEAGLYLYQIKNTNKTTNGKLYINR